jgi:TP901 family phage tail tape measure protein
MPLIGASNSLGGLSGSNAIARLLVVISGQSSQLEAAVAKSEGTLSGLSKNATAIGKTLTRSLTLPLLAIGGYAIKSASDFEAAFGRVLGLTTVLDKRFNDLGLSSDGLRQALLDMASDPLITATPTELADSLYYAGSAGLAASKAMEVVRLSAEGASVGMGDAADISKVLIFALTNFESEGLTASTAMDVLTAAIQEGTAAPDELAIALGRLLPVAKEAGLGFADVAASVAALSNLGVPTRVATTSMRALLAGLLAPTEAAKTRLNELGISAEDLKKAMGSTGLVGVFNILQRATHGNDEALHDIIPTIRGFTAYLGLSQDEAKRYIETFKAVKDSAGKFQNAIQIISQTLGFKLQKAFQSLQVAAVHFGEALLPIFLKVIGVITDVGNILSTLPGPVQTALAAFLTLGAAIGPVLQLYGAMTAMRATTATAGTEAEKLVPTFRNVATSIAVAGIAAAIAYGAFKSLSSGSGSLFAAVTVLVGSFIALQTVIRGLQTIVGLTNATGALATALTGLSTGGVALLAAGLAALITLTAKIIGDSRALGAEMGKVSGSLAQSAASSETLRTALEKLGKQGTGVQRLAEALNALDLPTGVALGKIQLGGGKEIISTLDQLQVAAANDNRVLPDTRDHLADLAGQLIAQRH